MKAPMRQMSAGQLCIRRSKSITIFSVQYLSVTSTCPPCVLKRQIYYFLIDSAKESLIKSLVCGLQGNLAEEVVQLTIDLIPCHLHCERLFRARMPNKYNTQEIRMNIRIDK
jgi:hypothetical protein